MVDSLTKEKRSWNMSRIRSVDTKPELLVRSTIHRQGFRFRKNVKGLPGKPDIVLPKHKTIVFVHGCFWHQHEGCKDGAIPKSRVSFWTEKLQKNVERDERNKKALVEQGWKVITIWECETKKPELLSAIIQERVISTL